MAIAIVVDKAAASVPSRMAFFRQAGFRGDIGESAIAVIVVEHDFAPVGDHQVVETIIVVVADAASLTPAGAKQSGFGGHVREGAVAIVVEEEVAGLVRGIDSLEASAIHQENVEPAVVVV